MSQDFLTHHFLLAMPSLTDPQFQHTVTYVCEHSEQGAMGIILNRPAELSMADIFSQMSITPKDTSSADLPLHYGGPVNQDRGFVIHSPAISFESTMPVSDDIAVTTSRDIIAAIATGEGPEHLFVALGYAGWEAGQLEAELSDNAWLSTPADPAVIFDTAWDKRWQRAAGLLGVDPQFLTGQAGHA